MGFGPADWTTNEYTSANPYVDETFNGLSTLWWSDLYGDDNSIYLWNAVMGNGYSFQPWSKTFPSAYIW